MRSGVAKAIREKWPQVYEQYKDWHMSYDAWTYAQTEDNPELLAMSAMLGHVQEVVINEDLSIINMAAQGDYGYDWKRYTSYDAFWSCLREIKKIVPIGDTIAFPDHIGCCRGGANWTIIKTMIEEALGSDYYVYIYKLEE